MKIIDTGGELQGRKMALKFLRKVNTTIKDLFHAQENIEQCLKPILNSPVIDGVLIKDIDVGTSDTVVNHKLGRSPLGWIVVKRNENAVIYESATTNNNRDKVLILKASSATTDTYFWIF